jgi:transcriptional regulator with XRE-family HTH domain
MSKPIDPNRLKEIRLLRKLSQEALSKKAKLSKESIHRLERGVQSGARPKTIDGLVKALEVEPGVLTGVLPIPTRDSTAPDTPDTALFEMYPMNYRVDGAVRNAFMIAALRYQVPVARIVELAPLLFVLAAEASLERRRAKLAELQDVFDRGDALRPNFPHLPYEIVPNFRADDAFAAEEESIDRHDILATTLPDEIFDTKPVAKDYDEDEDNPFVVSLQAEAERLKGVVVIERFHRHDTTFHVCPKDALALAGGDAKLADSILRGCIVLHKMPRELFSDNSTKARIAWLQEQERIYEAVLLDSLGVPSLESLGIDTPSDEESSR